LTNVESKRTTRAEPEDHLWSADHSLRNADLVEAALLQAERRTEGRQANMCFSLQCESA